MKHVKDNPVFIGLGALSAALAVATFILKNHVVSIVFVVVAIATIGYLVSWRQAAVKAGEDALAAAVKAGEDALAAADRKFDRYQRQIREIAIRHSCRFKEDLEVTWYVGETPKQDREVRRGISTPEAGFLLWRHVGFRSPGSQPREAADLEIKTRSLTNTRALSFVPDTEGQSVNGLVTFLPPVEGGSVEEWEVRSSWAGMWDPLRESGQDDAQFDHNQSGILNLTLRWVFPDTLVRPTFRQHPDSGTITTETVDNRAALVWVLPSAPPNSYKFTLGAERVTV